MPHGGVAPARLRDAEAGDPAYLGRQAADALYRDRHAQRQEILLPDLDDERIQFLDRVDDDTLLRAYQTARVALFAFKETTANNAMVEAMASGLPVVATNTGGVGEYITDGAGLLCQPQDPQALAAAALRLLDDADLQRSMSCASRRRALRLDWRLVAAKMCEIYSRLLPGR